LPGSGWFLARKVGEVPIKTDFPFKKLGVADYSGGLIFSEKRQKVKSK
jgi:hypothetical protein